MFHKYGQLTSPISNSSLQLRKELTVQWVPGHAGIEGNELADQEAKKYAKGPASKYPHHDSAYPFAIAHTPTPK